MRTSELIGHALDWAVEQVERKTNPQAQEVIVFKDMRSFSPSTKWAQAGPIVERERIELKPTYAGWAAFLGNKTFANGPTSLIAAMRCYVANKIGDEVEIPDELL